MGLPSGLVTFVFTDIEGSTSLFQRLGNRFPEVIERHRALILEPSRRAGGHLVKSEGDGLFLAFSDPGAALAALADAQRALAIEPWPDRVELTVRMGVHRGDALPSGDDYIAFAVHEAARVARAAHGGQILVSDAAAAAVDDCPGDISVARLGRYRLRDLDEPMVLHQLVGPDLREEFPAVRALPEAAHNMSIPATSLIGREREVAALRKRLAVDRFVTVVGEGGVGKSRVSIEVALAEADTRSGGAWLVEIEPLGAGALVAPTVASTIGAAMSPGRDSIDAITAQLASSDALLVIDGCESGLDGVAAVLEAIRDRCPRVAVLCASREPLRVDGEHVWPLPPLSTSIDDSTVADTAAAPRLFVSRARDVLPEWEPDADDLATVRSICEQLDGLPLAIELTAARLATTPLRELVDDLRGGEGAYGAVRAAYAGLGPSAQGVLRRLAVFRDGASPDAVSEVAGFTPVDPADVPDILAVLSQRALVRPRGRGRRGVRLLEPVREAAAELLQEAAELDTATLRHIVWASSWAADFRSAARIGEQNGSTVEELANLRSALEGAKQRKDEQSALSLTEGLFSYWDTRGLLQEALLHAEWLAQAADPTASTHGSVRAAQILTKMGRLTDAEERFAAVIPAVRELNNAALLADALSAYGNVVMQRGRPQEGLALVEEAVTLVDFAEAPGICLSVRNVQGVAHAMLGHADESAACFTEVRDRARNTTFRSLYGVAVLNLAVAAFARGDLDAAEHGAEEARAVLRDGFERMVPAAIRLRSNIAEGRGDFARARALLEECLRHRQRLGDATGELIDCIGIAHVSQRSGELAETLRWLERAAASPVFPLMRQAQAAALDTAAHTAYALGLLDDACRLAAAAGKVAKDMPFRPEEQRAHEELRSAVRAALDEDRADQLTAEGEAWDGDEAAAAIRSLARATS